MEQINKQTDDILKEAAPERSWDNRYDLNYPKLGLKLVRVDRMNSLKEVLENTIVFEYPTLYLVI